jgi:GNAT superfamily N-acetyltransferase
VSTAFTVRHAEAADAQAATTVLRHSITEICVADHQNDTATLERWLENKTPEQFLAWLAYDENYTVVAAAAREISGVGLLHRSGEVRLCYVRPEMQYRGIGTAILLDLEAHARVWQLKRLVLESTAGARGFYELYGYVSVGLPKLEFGVLHSHPYEKVIAP